MDRKVNIYILKHNINTRNRHVNGISKYLKQKPNATAYFKIIIAIGGKFYYSNEI